MSNNNLRQQFTGDLNIFHEGLAIAEAGEGSEKRQFHILPSGEPAYLERYKRAEYFQSGLAWVMEENGQWKRIDKNGKEVQMQHTSSLVW
ncbi:MAG: hypothetical protein NTV36_00625 [Candidatus Staskawiczbacteria bacterium]|nr:hypothetical protein [Candidatus Staskawiczbacteria bacterium]